MVGFGISAYQVHVGAIPSDTVGEVSIPTVLGGKPVTAICRLAFQNCDRVTAIKIPSSIEFIGDQAFSNCRSLMSVDMGGDAPDVGSDIFGGTSKRLVISVPDGSIGWNGGVTASLPESWCGRAITHIGEPYDWSGEVHTSTTLTLVTTNVNVSYVLNSVQPEFAIPASSDRGFVNIIAEVKGGVVSVPESWAAEYPKFTEKFGTDFAKALAMPTGKKDGAGNPMFVWQDYVAGTNPTDETDVFTASITIVAGKVKVSYSPELDDARKALRKYTTWGKKSLMDNDWTEVQEGQEAEYNFFKVTVEML